VQETQTVNILDRIYRINSLGAGRIYIYHEGLEEQEGIKKQIVSSEW
jgi:hypothetical protein